MRLIDADVAHRMLLDGYEIDDVPTIEAEPVRHGRWIEVKTGNGLFDYRFRCSECKNCTPDKAYTIAPDFCPNCGAKMDALNQ